MTNRKKNVLGKEAASSRKIPNFELEYEPRNEVFLLGRVSSAPVEKILPSGDTVVEFRIVVTRSQPRSTKKEIDTLDIAAWSARTRASALKLRPDTWVEIDGAVRRRFWQAPTGLASRWQVEASAIRRL
jgi:single-strand DNA-binding protein